MSSTRPYAASETSRLLDSQETLQSYNATDADSVTSIPPTQTEYTASSKISRADLAWVLAGLWSAVFLGALDGEYSFSPSYAGDRVFNTIIGTIVATLLSPIGSYFNESNRASYIGTSYLLSVCCFTPLYGAYKQRG